MAEWQVYIIRCNDDSLYTGITTNLERRFDQHLTGKGAKYFNGRKPLEIVYREHCADRGQASRREAAIKSLSRREKLQLIASFR
ncbi:GIY-YIG nuclease family protein [Thiolapillus brandeum]|uniref:Endonuclease n=1 Tax=Thiolapillus brandeum TaxID=1076588 RepID=A0A7U6GJB1_9GAMM|nr:GIY-YIG nuclease family protein [Thiolapillus brandeum]BAO44657.1 endonuclease [Thiolapillus brandeum]